MQPKAQFHLHSVDNQRWLGGRNTPAMSLVVRVELLESLQDQLAAVSLQLGKGEVDCSRIPQFFHFPAEFSLFYWEPSKFTDDTARLKTDIVYKDSAKEVKSEPPSAQKNVMRDAHT